MADEEERRRLKAEMLLEQVAAAGFTIEDLQELQAGGELAGAVTVHAYLPKVRAATPAKSRGVYRTYWDVLDVGIPWMCGCFCDACVAVVESQRDGIPVPCPCTGGDCDCPSSQFHEMGETCADRFEGLGAMRIVDVSGADLDIAAGWVKTRALKRQAKRNAKKAAQGRATRHTTGNSAVEHLGRAATRLFKTAVADPTSGVTIDRSEGFKAPRRPKTTARAYTAEQLAELWDAAFTSGGSDPELDALIIWFHLESGARRGGALNLTTSYLNWADNRVYLVEKGNKGAWQPVSAALVRALLGHALERGEIALDAPDDELPTVDDVVEGRIRIRTDRPVFYYSRRRRVVAADGTVTNEPHPLTRRRYNTLWDRIQRELPWADQLGARPHDLRKTGATFIERAFGFSVAKGWLRHATDDDTLTYSGASDEDLVGAAAWWAGEVPSP
jgi:integrase